MTYQSKDKITGTTVRLVGAHRELEEMDHQQRDTGELTEVM